MLVTASLRYFKATNAMVVLGVAVAVAVLAGALLVGASVRESLREMALGRLGATEVVITAPIPFRAALADDLASGSRLSASAADRPLRRDLAEARVASEGGPAPGSRLIDPFDD
jgi:hypothetical protein